MSIGDTSFSKKLITADIDSFFKIDKKEKILNKKFFDQPHVTIIDDDFVGETKNVKRKFLTQSNNNSQKNISIQKRSNSIQDNTPQSATKDKQILRTSEDNFSESRKSLSESRKSLK